MVYEKVSNILISIIFLIYNVFIIKYVVALFTKQKSNNNLILVYWLDYIIIIFSLFIISILFTIDLYINDNSKKASNVLVIDSDDFFPLLFESNFIIDILLSIQLLIKIRKMKKIKLKYLELIKMNKFIEKLDILSNYKIIQHLTLLLISYLINIFIIIISDYAIDKEKKNLFIKLFQIILFVLTITIMLFLREVNCGRVFFSKNCPNSFKGWNEILPYPYNFIPRIVFAIFIIYAVYYFFKAQVYVELWQIIAKAKIDCWNIFFMWLGIVVGTISEITINNMMLEETSETLFYISFAVLVYLYGQNKDFCIDRKKIPLM